MFGLSITERGHRILREYIRKGDVAVDCTRSFWLSAWEKRVRCTHLKYR